MGIEGPADDLFMRAACGLLVTSTDGTIRRVNATFGRWTGWSQDALVGRRFQDLLTAGGRIFHLTHWAPMLHMHGSIAEVKFDVESASGARTPMLFNAVRTHRDGDSWDDVAALVVHDRQSYERALLEARRSAEAAQERLARLARQKDTLLTTIVHELRNPLAPISNVLEVMKRQDLDDPTTQWARKILATQVGHLTHIIDDLLDASRVAQGKIRLDVRRVVLRDALETAVEAARPSVDRMHHTLDVQFRNTDVEIVADPTRLTQMLMNLLNNAVKYTPGGGRITIAVLTTADAVQVTVRDSGIGMTAEQLTHIFEMFNQAAPGVDRSEGGLGVGLALVRTLAEMHGGGVTASSGGAGLGSEFVLTLPLVGAQSTPE